MMFQRLSLPGMISILFGISLVLLVWQHYGLNKSLVINGKAPFDIVVADDRLDGGQSVATISRIGSALRLECALDKSFTWPYCEMGVELATPPNGIDFRSYQSVRMKMSYTGPGKHRVRFFMRNYHPVYSDLHESTTWKLNEVQFIVQDGAEVSLPLDKFNVASWWLADKNIPLDHYGVDLSNVPLLIISTAGLQEPGMHTIDIEYVIFEGKYISREQMLLLIVLLWGLLGIAVMVKMLLGLHLRLQKARLHASELIIANASLQEEKRRIADQAKLDPLTQVRNRSGIRNDIAREMEKADATAPLAMVICDIDHFKKVNDQHGHARGDEVLVKFAQILTAHVRHGDYVVRWGGEEFVLFLPQTEGAQAHLVAEKLREAVQNAIWPAGIALTASFGVSVVGPDGFGKALERADKALYAAKANGRNRVEYAQP
ncbi:GGDEF domain-containing protein [Chitinibacter sp. GC72]|uniref:GGDEF domain-containing protein n=1 Tax=Chitinibacter sp. GC72 TaxID=1526917 RepID=UPI0012F9365B|nr:GGDEF domain-containing protein [Chitinibacter sp. GC72]